jgi:hypothetical protein
MDSCQLIRKETKVEVAHLNQKQLAARWEKVIVSPNDLEVRLRANGIERLVLELRPEPVEQQAEAMA